MNGSTYHQLTTFLTIVQEGSIRAAARKLEVAPPSVSQALKQLEQQIGLPLLTRTTRQMELTDAGRTLVEQASPAVDHLKYALEAVHDLSEVPSGKVRITLPRFVCQLFLQPVYAEFCLRYPSIELEISVSDATVNIIGEGFDLGIRFGDRVEEGMVSIPLGPPMPDAVFASPEYLQRKGEPKTLSELKQHRLIRYRYLASNQLAPLVLRDCGQNVQVDMPAALVVNDTDLMVDAVRNGLGIGRMIAWVVQKDFDRGELVPVLQDHWIDAPPLHLCFAQRSQQAKRVRVLIDFLREKAAQYW